MTHVINTYFIINHEEFNLYYFESWLCRLNITEFLNILLVTKKILFASIIIIRLFGLFIWFDIYINVRNLLIVLVLA